MSDGPRIATAGKNDKRKTTVMLIRKLRLMDTNIVIKINISKAVDTAVQILSCSTSTKENIEFKQRNIQIK